ncbi:TPA: glycosyltransferase family 2 protein [Methanocaldococcus jannaschii]|uniref:Glycosyltransferase family 2 protein n=1 Tax=Methanocaldococcus jannaschii TaxID=2190 RepID=A0A832SVE0_9EURY|nr:glycosyltransferase family 2 protein [Methanocaldococcus jannaschii]
MDKPLVSVVMATYNEPEKYLKESIESILNQTFKDFEFIIVLDNPNNKKAEEIIKEYQQKDKRIIFIKNERNLGRGASRNKAVNIARGKYIAILDADDIALPKRLEKQFKYMENNRDIDLLFSWVYFIDENGNILKEFKPEKYKFKEIKKYFFKEHLTVHPSMMVKSKILKKLKYDEKLIRSQDYDFWIRCIANDYKFDIIEEFLLKYRIPNRDNYLSRIKKQKLYSYYTLKTHWKNKKHFCNNVYFWKVFFYSLVVYLFIVLTPTFILKILIDIKDKKTEISTKGH